MNRDDWRLARTLEWIARLPICGEPELAALLGIDPIDARHLVEALARRGWVESIEPGSPELELRRRWLVREQAVPALAAALDLRAADVQCRTPVRLNDTLDRVSRVEITVGVNRLLSDLAADLRRSEVADLVDALSLPLALPWRERWWLPRIEGYGCLRTGNLRAPFFVAWDRAGAPDVYRRRRVAAWSAVIAAVAAHWGAEGTPPVLVVCPSLRELRVWEQALLRRLDDGSANRLDALLTTREELRARGTGGALWRTPGTDRPISLVEGLGWGGAPPVQALCLPDDIVSRRERPAASEPSLRAWASARATDLAHGPHRRQIAVLALATTPEEKVLLEWVARHPLLSGAELCALLNESAALVERRLDHLARLRAIQTETARTYPHGGIQSQTGARETRYVLTELGIRALAARHGVPAATFSRHGGVTFVGGDDPPLERVIRHSEHTIGINRFFARLAAHARLAGWRLDEWRNEAESTHRFRDPQGRTRWIRPDGGGLLARGADVHPFLLEYDRGTLDAGDYRPKFEAYREYYLRHEWRGDFTDEPLLLFVCEDQRAERRVREAARSFGAGLAINVMAQWLPVPRLPAQSVPRIPGAAKRPQPLWCTNAGPAKAPPSAANEGLGRFNAHATGLSGRSAPPSPGVRRS